MTRLLSFRMTQNFFLLIFIMILANKISADMILLDDNEVLEGNIVNINEKEIIINTPKGELNVPKGIIKKYADNEEAERLLKEEIKHIQRTEKLDKVKKEVKEHAKEEIEKQIETATKIHSPKWTLTRSAIFPGWGQAEAGIAGGTALLVTSATGIGIMAYAHNLSTNLQQSYEQSVIQNLAIVTLIPSSATVQDRLAASYFLNQGACDGCNQVNHQERDFQQLFGVFYLAQLAYLANTLGIFSAAPVASKDDSFHFDFSVYQDRPIPQTAKQTVSSFNITIRF
ncbi:hypothetical protein EHQ58_02090 [Leptospira ognonensis]|uniref:DUF5683 domain-containing protein n=1 Tax=Leptospira ognonensis TaxID=2484945 RepID=A0A4R9KCV3_9LEPT|nr:hypothetical protein [Leptospira ognonensis]TGL62963.1 hypothetical protein EHQ58_02090 [Leptospira ognonensis]